MTWRWVVSWSQQHRSRNPDKPRASFFSAKKLTMLWRCDSRSSIHQWSTFPANRSTCSLGRYVSIKFEFHRSPSSTSCALIMAALSWRKGDVFCVCFPPRTMLELRIYIPVVNLIFRCAKESFRLDRSRENRENMSSCAYHALQRDVLLFFGDSHIWKVLSSINTFITARSQHVHNACVVTRQYVVAHSVMFRHGPFWYPQSLQLRTTRCWDSVKYEHSSLSGRRQPLIVSY